MGGQSTGNFSIVADGDQSHLQFQGEVRNVSFLHGELKWAPRMPRCELS